jgi:hypothetical protein
MHGSWMDRVHHGAYPEENGYFHFFTKLNAKEYKVVIFDYSCCEVVGMCPPHP